MDEHERKGVGCVGRMLARWFKPWPLCDGYISDPFGKVKWPPTIGGIKRSRLESPGVDVGGRKVVAVREAFNVVVYPSYNLGLQPVLGVDLLSFRRGHQRPTNGWLVGWLLVLNQPHGLPQFQQATALRCGLGTDAYRWGICWGARVRLKGGSEILKIVMDDVVEISVRSVDRDRGQDRTVSFVDFRWIWPLADVSKWKGWLLWCFW